MVNILGFFVGTLSLHFLTALPQVPYVLLLCVGAFGFLFLTKLRFILSLFLGFCWAAFVAQGVKDAALDSALVGKSINVTGVVASIPEKQGRRIRFEFFVDSLNINQERLTLPKKIRLNWYNDYPDLRAGERWQLEVKLKPARGLINPGSFDYERWLFENRITALGYVVKSEQNQQLRKAPWYSVDRWRQSLNDHLTQHYQGQHLALVKALLIGERSDVSEAQWNVLTATGTNHLLAISGLHIGLIAGFSFWIFSRVFRKTGKLLLYIPAHKLAALFALFSAVIYAALAGFSIPTQRALIMISVALIFLVINRHVSLARIVAYSLFAVLMLDPLSILATSFWLSFIAVTIIVFAMQGRIKRPAFWWQLGRLQWVISLAMIPVVMYAFQGFSIVSPLANVIAVPWVSFVVVPLAFVSVLFSGWEWLYTHLLALVDFTLHVIWYALEEMASWPYAKWQGAVSNLVIFLASFLGALLLIAPTGLPVRLPAVFLITLPFIPSKKTILPGEFKLTQLDVGQGLSSVVQTRNHVLVFDAGAKFSDSFDMGKAVIAPFLHSQSLSQIDTLVISHGDNDHIGGMDSLRQQFSIQHLLSGVMEKTPFTNAQACVRGHSWHWDGVRFDVLHPEKHEANAGNDGSCVIKVSNESHALLLTGDIEKAGEKALLRYAMNHVDVDVLIAPHHGSKTSSTPEFVKASSPEFVVYPAGYKNRYGFPKQAVFDRYLELGSQPLTTGALGAIEMRFIPQQKISFVSWRILDQKIWRAPAN